MKEVEDFDKAVRLFTGPHFTRSFFVLVEHCSRLEHDLDSITTTIGEQLKPDSPWQKLQQLKNLLISKVHEDKNFCPDCDTSYRKARSQRHHIMESFPFLDALLNEPVQNQNTANVPNQTETLSSIAPNANEPITQTQGNETRPGNDQNPGFRSIILIINLAHSDSSRIFASL